MHSPTLFIWGILVHLTCEQDLPEISGVVSGELRCRLTAGLRLPDQQLARTGKIRVHVQFIPVPEHIREVMPFKLLHYINRTRFFFFTFTLIRRLADKAEKSLAQRKRRRKDSTSLLARPIRCEDLL